MKDQSSVPTFILKESEPAQEEEKLSWEKELLGLYISGHPLNKFREKLEEKKISIKKAKDVENGMPAIIAGIIETTKVINTKKGEQMSFVKIADFTDDIEVVVFPRILSDYKDILSVDKVVAIEGRVSRRNGGTSIIAEKVKELK